MVSTPETKKERTGISINPRIQYVLLMAFSVAIGLAAAGGAFLFRWLIENFQLIFWADGRSFLDMIANSPWWLVLLLPCVGGIIAGIIITN
jgi:CIC family chloride channel protein